MEEKFYRPEQWWVSLYNFKAEVNSTFTLPGNVQIHDATLRDGEQTPGIVFRKEDKVRIARKLDDVGVERIEAGMPAVSEEDFAAIKEISGLGLKAKIYSFARMLKTDIDSAVACGTDGVVMEIPIGYPKLKYQFHWTWKDVLERSVDVINYAKDKGLHVVYFPYDTTRAREDDLKHLLDGIVERSRPDAVGVVDTMGCALPQAIAYLVRTVKDITGLPVEIHTHNDFGLAVANELAAVSAGAGVVHSCVNGLGERTGNAALEELILGLHVLFGYATRYRLDKLCELAELVETISQVPIARNKPIIGRRNFTRESGIGVDLVVKEPLAMFALDPRILGKTGDVVLGKKSGKLSVLYFLEKLGIKAVGDEEVQAILAEVKARGTEKRALVTPEEFREIVARILAG
jgi:isopropylmalate/homocitrate/citramalate synthase